GVWKCHSLWSRRVPPSWFGPENRYTPPTSNRLRGACMWGGDGPFTNQPWKPAALPPVVRGAVGGTRPLRAPLRDGGGGDPAPPPLPASAPGTANSESTTTVPAASSSLVARPGSTRITACAPFVGPAPPPSNLRSVSPMPPPPFGNHRAWRSRGAFEPLESAG